MLSRLIPKPAHLRRFLPLPSKPYSYPQSHFPYSPNIPYFTTIPKYFSTNSSDNNNNFQEREDKFDAFFTEESGSLAGMNEGDGEGPRAPTGNEDQWWLQEKGLDNEDEDSIFKGIDKDTEEVGNDLTGRLGVGAEDIAPWSLKEDEEGDKVDLLNIQEDESQVKEFSVEESEDAVKLEKEEQELTAILKGPIRAFGDLISASGITDELLDSLIALNDFDGVDGLSPLSVLEDMRYEKSFKKSTRAEIERLKQEEAAKARVRQVDDKGRAYGTGRRKCSVSRVWVQPGSGKFIVNDKEFDVYFPMLDHRATLLRPFYETKTLGLWDVNCTVKGGGVSGQVGAI